ncbi:Ig-like domain-containing protein [Bdellovibrio sp. SKB1291214]|uniref:Ig-like domain-containing protein n=1 Tax=Bdellovibrio sp. SKB1291214 TaxID=1732569 RepID=UPI00223F9E97|nr:Ig-like domain-containing protein [Bdellovibrio sp. SKB1291214]UYL09303.1 Ig-like domain-containing protein [Bdellovibrio sp. SKB1291214]
MGTHVRNGKASILQLLRSKLMLVVAFALGNVSCSMDATIADILTVNTGSLSGRIANYATNSNQASAQDAMACVTPVVNLYKLDSSGQRISPPAASVGADDTGAYSIDLKNAGFETEALKASPMLIEVKGCAAGVYFRPVTGYAEQNVTMSSSLLGYIVNTDFKDKLSMALQDNGAEVDNLMLILGSPDSMEKAYNVLLANTEASDKFTQIFGVAPSALLDASPEVLSYSLPASAQEKVALQLEADAAHWLSSYPMIYEWKLNATTLGTAKSVSHVPGGNSQGNHAITLTIGRDNGSGHVDLTKPNKSFSGPIQISNNVLPQPPNFSVTSPSIAAGQPVSTRALVIGITTGAALANCDSFSSLLMTETSSIPSASENFPIVCSQVGSQSLNYTLASSGEGSKTLYLWAKDASGLISTTPVTLTLGLDTAAPTVTISTQPLAQSKSSSQVIAFTGNDGSGTIDHFECKLDSSAWGACSSPASFAGLTEGDHTVSVRAIDTAGNTSNIDSKTWHIDLTAPTLTLTGPAAVTNSLSATLTMAGVDTGGSGLATYQCSLDGAAYATCTAVMNYVLAAGSHTFKSRVYDGAGNVSSVQTHSWTIDTTPPTVTITSKPAAMTNSMTGTFAFVGTDTGGASISGYECELDGGGYSACTTGKSYSSLADGSHTFKVRATDSAGNIGTATTYTWTINTVSPMASITASPDNITNQTTANFSFYATPPSGGSISSYQCNLDSAGWATCSSPKSYTGLTQGSHTFEVRSIDNLSNVSDATSYTWLIDTTNPTLTITDKPDADTNTATAQFKFTGGDTGGATIEKYYCELDSAGYTECASPKNYTSLAEGSHTFNVKVMDTAGNTSAVQTYSWDVDLTAPTLTLLTKPNSLTNQTTAAFTFSGADSSGSVAGYECKIDGGAVTSCTSGVSYSSLAAGAHSFEVSALDAAVNYSAAVSYSWTIDTAPPTVTITAKPSANANSATAVFGFTGLDTGGGSVSGFKCKLDGGSYSTCVSGGSYSSLSEGSHTVSIYASDTAGNDGTPVTYTWVVDTVAPTVTITTPSANNYVIPSANLSAVTIGGACSENGVAVNLSGVTAAPTLCSGNAWVITANMSSLADGPYTLTASQTDSAGNTGSSSGRSVIKDATAPSITVTTPGVVKGGGTITASWVVTEANVASSSSFAIEFYDGATWTSAGSKTATAGANTNVTYSLTGISVPGTNTNAAKVRVTLTDAAGNVKTVTSGSFAIDSSAPTLSSFTVNGGSANTTNNNVLIGFNGSDSLSNISKICMSTSGTAPTSSSSCWIPVASYGLTAAKNLSTSSIYYNVGFVSGAYTIYIWLMDAVGNISTNSSTASVDKGSVYYNSPNPPSVGSIQLTSTNTPTSPPSGSDLVVTSGSAIYLKWNVSSSTGLAANPISITYTTDDATTAGTLATGLANGANGGCTVTSGFTGCAVLSAPVGTYFRLKMKTVDSLGFFSTISSNPLNSGQINFLAGNTDLGLNSSAKSAIIQPSGGANALQVLDDGRIFVLDTRGLAWVNPTNGVYEILATYAGSMSGDGGELTNAKFKAVSGIYKDANNDILVADSQTIRRINTRVSPMTISRVVGGGNDTGSYVATATNYKASINIRHLSVSSNGDIFFVGENGHKVRKYNAATGAVSLITLSGTGNSSSPTQDNTLCGFIDYFVTFDASGNVDKMIWEVSSQGSSSSCTLNASTTETRAYAQVDPSTGIAMSPIPDHIVTTDGYREYVSFYNDRVGNVYSAYDQGTPAQGIWKFDSASMTWARVWGSDQYGTCSDGTFHTSCAINTMALTFNSQGQPFYIDVKSKAVRTIDNDGYVRTIAGDKLGSDDGKMPLVTRFANLTDVKSWNSLGTSYITVYDFGDVRVREFVPGSSVTTLAGLQYSKAPSAGNVAATSPIHNSFDISPTRILVNSNGDVYMPRAQGSTGRIVRSSGLWESWSSVGSYGPQPVGIYGNTMILGAYSYNGSINRMTDSRYFWVDLTSKVFTKKLYDTNGGSTQIPATICADGSALNGGCSLAAGVNDVGMQAQYDPGTNSWLLAEPNATRIAKFAYDGTGTMGTLFTAPRAFSRFAVKRSTDLSSNYVYTCASGILYKYDLNNSGAESVIALPNTTFTCESALHYDSYRNTLLFIYKQNGLKGVAEVVNP